MRTLEIVLGYLALAGAFCALACSRAVVIHLRGVWLRWSLWAVLLLIACNQTIRYLRMVHGLQYATVHVPLAIQSALMSVALVFLWLAVTGRIRNGTPPEKQKSHAVRMDDQDRTGAHGRRT